MFSSLKSRKALVIATVLLLSAASEPVFAMGCMSRPDNDAQKCAEICAWAAVGGPLGFLLCF